MRSRGSAIRDGHTPHVAVRRRAAPTSRIPPASEKRGEFPGPCGNHRSGLLRLRRTRLAWSSFRFSPMGTRIRFLGWNQTGFGTPLFFCPPFIIAKSTATSGGRGPASLLESYGKRKRSIDSGVPFRKGTGRFLRASQRPRRKSQCRRVALYNKV